MSSLHAVLTVFKFLMYNNNDHHHHHHHKLGLGSSAPLEYDASLIMVGSILYRVAQFSYASSAPVTNQPNLSTISLYYCGCPIL